MKLHVKDLDLLNFFKNTLGISTITLAKIETCNLNVYSIKELQIIVNHFTNYPLITCKTADFLLFKEAFEIIKSGKHLTEKGLLKILGLKSAINLGLSEKLLRTVIIPKFYTSEKTL